MNGLDRLKATDIAERVLHIYERAYPGDARPRRAIDAARRVAKGEISDAERTAAYFDACSAALDAKRESPEASAAFAAAFCAEDCAEPSRATEYSAKKAESKVAMEAEQ